MNNQVALMPSTVAKKKKKKKTGKIIEFQFSFRRGQGSFIRSRNYIYRFGYNNISKQLQWVGFVEWVHSQGHVSYISFVE